MADNQLDLKKQQNLEMMSSLIEKLKTVLDREQTTTFEFKVIIKKGKIEEIDYYSSYKIYFDT